MKLIRGVKRISLIRIYVCARVEIFIVIASIYKCVKFYTENISNLAAKVGIQ